MIRVIRGEIIYFIEITHSSDFVQSSIVIVSLSVRSFFVCGVTRQDGFSKDPVLKGVSGGWMKEKRRRLGVRRLFWWIVMMQGAARQGRMSLTGFSFPMRTI